MNDHDTLFRVTTRVRLTPRAKLLVTEDPRRFADTDDAVAAYENDPLYLSGKLTLEITEVMHVRIMSADEEFEADRPWRGGKCVCNTGDKKYHSHFDDKPHACAVCSCQQWRKKE